MKIIAISDTHGQLPELPACDLLLIGGDVCPDLPMVAQKSWLETNFTRWLARQTAEHVIGIAGNHDFVIEKFPEVARSLPWTYLLDETVVKDGVRIHGIPWVPNLSRWAFHLDDAGLDKKFELVPTNADIVVSHGPPFGYCDRTVPKFGDVHAGFPGSNDTIERVKPKLFVCGHIHEGYGWMLHDKTKTMIANVSYMTENYEPINAPAVFEIQRGKLWSTLDYPPTREVNRTAPDLSRFDPCGF